MANTNAGAGAPRPVKVEIVLSDDGVIDMAINHEGRRTVITDLSQLALDVTNSGVRFNYSLLTELGKKRAHNYISQFDPPAAGPTVTDYPAPRGMYI